MKILIDADACPVWRLAEEIGEEYNLEVLLFSDISHLLNANYGKVITCDLGPDMVDFTILKYLEPNDIVITQDYGLASLVLSKKAFAINQNGMEYTNNNIDNLLNIRYINKEIRNSGGKTKGPSPRKKEQDKAFQNGFKNILIRELNK